MVRGCKSSTLLAALLLRARPSVAASRNGQAFPYSLPILSGRRLHVTFWAAVVHFGNRFTKPCSPFLGDVASHIGVDDTFCISTLAAHLVGATKLLVELVCVKPVDVMDLVRANRHSIIAIGDVVTVVALDEADGIEQVLPVPGVGVCS